MLKKDIWRSLFVKCFRFILFFTMIISARMAVTQVAIPEQAIKPGQLIYQESIVNRVLPPVEGPIVKNNEIYKLEIESSLSDDEIKSLKNQKINDVMYVMEVIFEEDKRFFQVFVTDPPKPKKTGEKDKENKEQIKIVFDRSLMNYQPTNKDQGIDFITMETPYNIEEVKSLAMKGFVYTLVMMIILPLVVVGSKLIKLSIERRNELKKRQVRADELIALWSKTKERDEFEEIFALKDEYLKLIDMNEREFKKFMQAINKYQYQRDWSEVEFKVLVELKNKTGELRLASGV